ncbi:C39 family peptidase [Streptomyces sp. H34-S4]|uniref:C39 family peptidase n=1 Tax=Streptomyces sp. H34-S4 TaxID=2996463 RepID=UPI00227106DB|nr:C39 family peptidase [Streptomyces sp. H34-S4]MCY0939507.1 C39 family peptidase [Streptomyces sp. H34-S4]
MGNISVRHQVPYYSQWESAEFVPGLLAGHRKAEDDPFWQRSGADSVEEYAFWSWRICGMACLRMALDHWGLKSAGLVTLAREFLEAGAYVRREDGVDGLIYAPFARHAAKRWGIEAEVRTELTEDDLPGLLQDGALVILSVHPSIRDLSSTPPGRGGHLVLAVGCSPTHLQIHNPSGLPGVSQRFTDVPWSVLPRFFARRGVVLKGDRVG